MSENALF